MSNDGVPRRRSNLAQPTVSAAISLPDGKSFPRTKLVCTVATACSKDTLRSLIVAGMNVARLNFAHGETEDHHRSIVALREAMNETRRLCAIILDTKGPVIRTGAVANGEVELVKGQMFSLVTDESTLGDSSRVAVQFAQLPHVVKPGSSVVLDNGLICLQVAEVVAPSAQEGEEPIAFGEVRCRVITGGRLGNRKAVAFPGMTLDLPAVTQKDLADIKFAVSNGVDFIAACVRRAADVITIREILGSHGRAIKIIAKIESPMGVENFDSIIAEADGVLIARHKLSVHMSAAEASAAHQSMVARCNQSGKFVVCMAGVPSTEADPRAWPVADAVLQGADAILLSAPATDILKAAAIALDIFCATEATIPSAPPPFSEARLSVIDAIVAAAVRAQHDTRASFIIVLSETGRTASLIAKHRPACPIFALSSHERVARQSLCTRSLFPLLVGSMIGTASLVDRAIATARRLGVAKPHDFVIVTAGSSENSPGSTNMIRILQVDEY